MTRLKRYLSTAAALTLVATVAAAGQAGQQAREAIVSEMTLRGTVEAVDHAARTIRIRGDQGNIMTLDVPTSYQRFDQVRVGDIVTIGYYDKVSVKLKAPGEAAVDRVAESTELMPGLLPSGSRTQQRITTVTLEAWDPATRVIRFTNSKGMSYTRHVSETVDASILIGIKVGDRIDVTRTEATRLNVETPAPPAAQAQMAETLRDRLTIGILWGVDNSFSGEIAQDGSGEFQGVPITFKDTAFDDVYGRIGLFKITIGYKQSPKVEANLNFVFSNSGSEQVELGTIGASATPMLVTFDDYNYWGIEGGQRFMFSRSRFTPFAGYFAGINHISTINAAFSASFTEPTPVQLPSQAVQFYDSSWALSFGFTGGILVPLGPVELVGELNLRYMGGLADVPPLEEVGLGHINDDSSRWSLPFLFGVRIRF